jgi:hypothetical protein
VFDEEALLDILRAAHDPDGLDAEEIMRRLCEQHLDRLAARGRVVKGSADYFPAKYRLPD